MSFCYKIRLAMNCCCLWKQFEIYIGNKCHLSIFCQSTICLGKILERKRMKNQVNRQIEQIISKMKKIMKKKEKTKREWTKEQYKIKM